MSAGADNTSPIAVRVMFAVLVLMALGSFARVIHIILGG
jgi:hypothetical protein